MYETKKILYVGPAEDLKALEVTIGFEASKCDVNLEITDIQKAVAEKIGEADPRAPEVVLEHLRSNPNKYDLIIFSELCEDSVHALKKNPEVYKGKTAILDMSTLIDKDLQNLVDCYVDALDEDCGKNLLGLLV